MSRWYADCNANNITLAHQQSEAHATQSTRSSTPHAHASKSTRRSVWSNVPVSSLSDPHTHTKTRGTHITHTHTHHITSHHTNVSSPPPPPLAHTHTCHKHHMCRIDIPCCHPHSRVIDKQCNHTCRCAIHRQLYGFGVVSDMYASSAWGTACMSGSSSDVCMACNRTRCDIHVLHRSFAHHLGIQRLQAHARDRIRTSNHIIAEDAYDAIIQLCTALIRDDGVKLVIGTSFG